MKRLHKKSYPLVSIVVPNYNYARFLDRRMNSILNQTYQNFEIILLDDCSTDNSREVIERYRNNEKVVAIVYNKENSHSPSKQWAKGIMMAKGELVWIAEADDSCAINLLEELVNAFISRKNCVVACSHILKINENGVPLLSYVPRIPIDWYLTGKQYLTNFLLFGCDIENASCAIFSRSAAFQIIDDRTWLEMPGANDYLFWCKLALMGDIVKIHKPLDIMCRHQSAKTRIDNLNGINYSSEKIVVDWILSHVRIPKYKVAIAYSLRRRIVSESIFDTPEIKNNLLQLWQNVYSCNFVNILLLKCFFKRFNLLYKSNDCPSE